MVEKDVSWSSMVNGYCKHERIGDARDLFDRMSERNVIDYCSDKWVFQYAEFQRWVWIFIRNETGR